MSELDLIALVPKRHIDPDTYQDIVVALLDRRPQTVVEAELLIKRMRNAADVRRHRSKARSQLLPSEPVAEYASDERHHRLVLALPLLTPKSREVVECVLHGMSQKATAKHLGVEPGTVMHRVRRAVCELQKILVANDDFRPPPCTDM